MSVTLPATRTHDFTPTEPPRTLDVIEPVFEKLLAMPVDDENGLKAYLSAWDETSSWVGDHISRSRVATHAHTDDEEAAKTWGLIVQHVMPALSAYSDRLGRKLLDSPALVTIESGKYARFLREVRVGVELFREENIPLEQRAEELSNEYSRITGGWSIDFDGEPRTMSQMLRYHAARDRDVRKAAWFATSEEVARTSEALEELFEELFEVRSQVAKNAGFSNYRDYVFAEKLRDYDPEACYAFAEIVEQEVVPLLHEIADWKRERLELDSYRPWDDAADPQGGEPLRPFENTEELKDGVERMMRRLDPELAEMFAEIRPNMDLDSRPHKAQGGFMTWYSWERRPFIYANASGNHTDVVTLLHEAGHAFHNLLSVDAKPIGMSVPMEFNEVTSMAQELLHYGTLNEFYAEDERARAIEEHLLRIPRLLASVARGDMFQHWLYTHPEHSREERRAKWVAMNAQYMPHIDCSGVDERYLADSYHRVLHFFVVPFYFIEYGFAQLGALQVAVNAERDLPAAMKAYKHALSLGPQRDTAGLYEAAGAEFVPTREKLRELMDWIRAHLF